MFAVNNFATTSARPDSIIEAGSANTQSNALVKHAMKISYMHRPIILNPVARHAAKNEDKKLAAERRGLLRKEIKEVFAIVPAVL
jgi:hypothetical protein